MWLIWGTEWKQSTWGLESHKAALIARFTGQTWGPSGAVRTQVGPMLAPWTLLSGRSCLHIKTVLPDIMIPKIKIRWSWDLIFIMGSSILVRWHLYIDMAIRYIRHRLVIISHSYLRIWLLIHVENKDAYVPVPNQNWNKTAHIRVTSYDC